ncbi:hypothetical protein D3C80_1528970 [compost metagenome]
MLVAVVSDILQLEALRQQEVDLYSGQGFFFAKRGTDLHIQLRSVECCFAFRFKERQTGFFRYLAQHTLCSLPHFIVLEVLLSILRITVGKTETVIVNTEIAVYLLDQL